MAQAVFFHIPRTGGSSIMAALTKAFGTKKVYWVGNGARNRNDFIKADNFDRFASYPVIGGHFGLSIAERLPWDKHYFAAIRDPVDRAISLYQFVRNRRNHPLHKILVKASLIEAIERSEFFRLQISNFQSRLLCGSPNFNIARQSIHQYQINIMPHGKAQNIADAICHSARLDPVIVDTVNSNTTGYSDKLATPSAVDLIDQLNREDRRLYNFVLADHALRSSADQPSGS